MEEGKQSLGTADCEDGIEYLKAVLVRPSGAAWEIGGTREWPMTWD